MQYKYILDVLFAQKLVLEKPQEEREHRKPKMRTILQWIFTKDNPTFMVQSVNLENWPFNWVG